jgi:hypothetical protein
MQSEHHEPTPLYEDGALLPPRHYLEQQRFTYLRSQIPPTMEPAWQAMAVLQGVGSDELRDVLLHPTFRLMPRNAQVPVSPCRVCGDGALHTAGTIQTSMGQLLVRACDTCGLVDLDPCLVAHH